MFLVVALFLGLLKSWGSARHIEGCTVFGTPKPGVSPRCEEGWLEYHQQQSEKIRDEAYELLFYGDSIFESFLGTCTGNLQRTCPWNELGADVVWNETYQHAPGSAKVGCYACGGDQTSHLVWHIQNGWRTKRPPRAAVLLIGTNDLHALMDGQDASSSPEDDAHNVFRRIEQLWTAVADVYGDITIITVGLLPRGTPTVEQLFGTARTNDTTYKVPNWFTERIDIVNRYLLATVHTVENAHGVYHRGAKLKYVECSQPFLSKNKDRVLKHMMPDALHPSGEGMRALTDCLGPTLHPFLYPHKAHIPYSPPDKKVSAAAAPRSKIPRVVSVKEEL